MRAVTLHRFRNNAGLAIIGQPGGTVYLTAEELDSLIDAARALARDLKERRSVASTFELATIGARP